VEVITLRHCFSTGGVPVIGYAQIELRSAVSISFIMNF